MRVIHTVRQLNPGGIECWLDRLVQNWRGVDAPEFHIALEVPDFGSLSPRFEAAGARLHYCPAPTEPGAVYRFLNLLEREGPFDVVHCHNHHASAFHVALAAVKGVSRRIVQSHADFRHAAQRWGLVRQMYRETSRKLLQQLATAKVAVAEGAAYDLFGGMGPEVHIMPCGTDLGALLEAKRPRARTRFTLVHVGRLVPEKNHSFLLRVFAEVARREPGSQLWLVGDGPLRRALEVEVAGLGCADRVRFWGNRSDIPAILAQADVFVFPSLSEGLGLAAVEAQAAGLPVVLGTHLPRELVLFPTHCRRLALELPVQLWADSILELRGIEDVDVRRREEVLMQSPFSIGSNIRKLKEVYAF
jgi:glycosyltransferase involved in cell wall biosynthesis